VCARWCADNEPQTKLTECRRVLLLNYDAERDVIEWRHYRIIVRPVGINRAVKKAGSAHVDAQCATP
jgi:hypothetical protein